MSPECKLTQFRNCRLLRQHQLVRDDLWVRHGKIVDPEKIFFDEKRQAHVQIDCNGAILAPGFIDLQINGGYGVDFSNDIETVEEGVRKVAKGLLSHGVTSFCPTLVTSPPGTYHTVLPKISKKPGGHHGATILGCHVEGPFINSSKKGAHPQECIKEFDDGFQTLLNVYGSLENVCIVTLAPEKDGASKVIRELSKRGITVSVGHSMANLHDGEVAVQHGAKLITHLFNAMLPFHHRDPGLVGLLTTDNIPLGSMVYYGIISDGVHTHPAALRIAYKTHPDGLILVTDAISAMGLNEGRHRIGQMDIEVRGGQAYVANTNTLCGSIAPMDECIRFFKKASDCSIVYALEAASLHPARCIGIEKSKGTLEYGADADFVVLDETLTVLSTWIAGDCVYENGAKPKSHFKSSYRTNNIILTSII